MEQKDNRQQQSTETKQRILEAVSELMKKRDIRDVKIREICKLAGISIGTFYLYFPCKEAALLYGHHVLDDQYEKLEFTDDPKHNIELIISSNLGILSEENFQIQKQSLICQLTYYDDYYFSESRPLFKVLFQQLTILLPQEEPEKIKDLTWNLISLIRGYVYNLHIGQIVDVVQWKNEKVNGLMEYLDFRLTKLN